MCRKYLGEIPMPVSPSGVSGISASSCHFRACRSLDELWIFWVGPATLQIRTGTQIRKNENSLRVHAAGMHILSNPFLKFCISTGQPPLFNIFFNSIISVPHVCPSIWHIENSRASLWNPRYSEKDNLPELFASTFSFVMPILHESEHTKLISSLIINLLLVVCYRQSLSCELIDKSQVDLNSSNNKYFLLWPPWLISVALLFFELSTSNHAMSTGRSASARRRYDGS